MGNASPICCRPWCLDQFHLLLPLVLALPILFDAAIRFAQFYLPPLVFVLPKLLLPSIFSAIFIFYFPWCWHLSLSSVGTCHCLVLVLVTNKCWCLSLSSVGAWCWCCSFHSLPPLMLSSEFCYLPPLMLAPFSLAAFGVCAACFIFSYPGMFWPVSFFFFFFVCACFTFCCPWCLHCQFHFLLPTFSICTVSFSFAALGVVQPVQVSFVATIGVALPVHFLLAPVLCGQLQFHLLLPVSFTQIPFFHFLLPSVLCHQFSTFWPQLNRSLWPPTLHQFICCCWCCGGRWKLSYFDCCSCWCWYDGCSFGHFSDLSKNHSICLLCTSLFNVGALSVLVGSDDCCHFEYCRCRVCLNLEMFSDIGLAWDYPCNLFYDAASPLIYH